MMIAGFAGADERALNEVRGWLLACATQSAGHMTDYVVDAGTAALFGGARTRTLVRWCVKAGLLKPTTVGGATAWIIVNDPDFIHVRTRAEVEWDRQRRSDLANTGLTVPVRLRDGDNCRYCGVLVQWRGKKSNRSAELDHRVPGEAATIDTLVVACRTCNGSRQANPQWDDDHPLRPAPIRPHFSVWTARFLTENGYPTDPNVNPDAVLSADAALLTSGARAVALADVGRDVDATAPADGDTARCAIPGAEFGAAPDVVPAPADGDTARCAIPGAEAGLVPADGDTARCAIPGAGPAGSELPSKVPRNSVPCSAGTGLPGTGREVVGVGMEGEGPAPGRRRGRRGSGRLATKGGRG